LQLFQQTPIESSSFVNRYADLSPRAAAIEELRQQKEKEARIRARMRAKEKRTRQALIAGAQAADAAGSGADDAGARAREAAAAEQARQANRRTLSDGKGPLTTDQHGRAIEQTRAKLRVLPGQNAPLLFELTGTPR